MKEARMLGNKIQHLAQNKGLSVSDLSSMLGCDEHQVLSLYKGRAYASYAKIKILAYELGSTVEELLKGDPDVYKATVVHCMHEFENEDNREKILDIIDGYIDIIDALN